MSTRETHVRTRAGAERATGRPVRARAADGARRRRLGDRAAVADHAAAPAREDFWWLLVQPPLWILLAGLGFHLFVARPLVEDLDA